MNTLFDNAVEVLRNLPKNLQETAAQAIIAYAAEHDEGFVLSDEQVVEVKRRMINPNRSFLSLEETQQRLRHFGV